MSSKNHINKSIGKLEESTLTVLLALISTRMVSLRLDSLLLFVQIWAGVGLIRVYLLKIFYQALLSVKICVVVGGQLIFLANVL